jgi:hypothetical protein
VWCVVGTLATIFRSSTCVSLQRCGDRHKSDVCVGALGRRWYVAFSCRFFFFRNSFCAHESSARCIISLVSTSYLSFLSLSLSLPCPQTVRLLIAAFSQPQARVARRAGYSSTGTSRSRAYEGRVKAGARACRTCERRQGALASESCFRALPTTRTLRRPRRPRWPCRPATPPCPCPCPCPRPRPLAAEGVEPSLASTDFPTNTDFPTRSRTQTRTRGDHRPHRARHRAARAWAQASRPLRSRLRVCVHLVVIPPAPRPVRSESPAPRSPRTSPPRQ